MNANTTKLTPSPTNNHPPIHYPYHKKKEAAYSNFRFWSETLLAEFMPHDVEDAWLDYHNRKGGRRVVVVVVL